MEMQIHNNKKNILKYGFFLGLAGIVVFLFDYFLEIQLKQELSFWMFFSTILSVTLTIIIIVFSLKKISNNNEKKLTISKILKIGLIVAFIGGIVFALFDVVFTTFIDTTYTQKLIDAQMNEVILQNPSLSEEDFELEREITTFLHSDAVSVVLNILSFLFEGFVISLILGVMMRRKNYTPEKK